MEFHEENSRIFAGKPCPVSGNRRQRRQGKMPPVHVLLRKKRKTLVLHQQHKRVYKDMQVNPEIEVSVSDASYAWIRLHGKAVFEDNMEIKEACMENPIVKGQYSTADNPIFVVFYLEDPHGMIADFSGNPPYEF